MYMYHRFRLAVAFTAITIAPVAGQERQVSRPGSAALKYPFLRIPPRVAVQAPTVIAFARTPDQLDSSLTAEVRGVAAGLGFDFAVVVGSHRVITDVRYYAIHYVPDDVTVGFVLLVPGQRSDLIRALIDSQQLEERMRAYLADVRQPSLRQD